MRDHGKVFTAHRHKAGMPSRWCVGENCLHLNCQKQSPTVSHRSFWTLACCWSFLVAYFDGDGGIKLYSYTVFILPANGGWWAFPGKWVADFDFPIRSMPKNTIEHQVRRRGLNWSVSPANWIANLIARTFGRVLEPLVNRSVPLRDTATEILRRNCYSLLLILLVGLLQRKCNFSSQIWFRFFVCNMQPLKSSNIFVMYLVLPFLLHHVGSSSLT